MKNLLTRIGNAPFNKKNLVIICLIIILLHVLLFVLVNWMVPPYKKLW